jgi:hypothetical protein
MLPPPPEHPISQMRLRAASGDALEVAPAEEIEWFGDGRPTDVDELCWGAIAELGA